jgi:hypothetical protein
MSVFERITSPFPPCSATNALTVDEVKDSKENLSTVNAFVAEQGVNGDVILSNTDITVTNVVNKEEADIINGYNDVSGTVTLTSVTDILENVNALSSTAGISIATSDLKVTDVTTLSDATDLDSYTTGEVTLDIVTDSFLNVQSIHNLTPTEENPDGVDLTAATITITDPVSLVQANTANGFSGGLITLNSVVDSFDNLIAIDAIPSDQLTMADAAVQVTDEVDLSKINDLRADTTGDITVDIISDSKINLSKINGFIAEPGVAGDVILSNSAITVIDDVSKEEAESINTFNDVSGIVTLTSVTDILNNVNELSTTEGISFSPSNTKFR